MDTVNHQEAKPQHMPELSFSIDSCSFSASKGAHRGPTNCGNYKMAHETRPALGADLVMSRAVTKSADVGSGPAGSNPSFC